MANEIQLTTHNRLPIIFPDPTAVPACPEEISKIAPDIPTTIPTTLVQVIGSFRYIADTIIVIIGAVVATIAASIGAVICNPCKKSI